MRTVLMISILLIIFTAAYSLNRFGLNISGFLKGDGSAVLQAATALIGIWALVIGFSITAIGATIELSKLPPSWKFSLFRRTIIRKLIPFFILGLLGGIIPFWGILHCRVDTGVHISNVTPWLIVGFILQLLLVTSAAFAAKTTYKELTLVPAIKSTLFSIDHKNLISLKDAHKEAFKLDHEEGNRPAMIPFSGYGSGIKGKAASVHDELVIVFKTLFLETEPQKLDAGFRAVSEWIDNNSLNEIDSYLEYRLLPTFFHSIRTDPNTFNAQIFRTRLYYVARLINLLQKAGATLSASNSANPLWGLIDDYSHEVGMSRALESARMGIEQILSNECRLSRGFSILINNLANSMQRLALEHNAQSLYVMEWLLEWHRYYLEGCLFRIWPKSRQSIDHLLQTISLMYSAIDAEYGNDTALWAGMHDMRYWILIALRRMQEAFVGSKKPDNIIDDQKELAYQDYESFNTIISKLLEIRQPEGDKVAYGNFKYKENPYT